MAAWLLFFLIGMAQFGVHVWLRRRQPVVRFASYVVSGILVGGVIALLPIPIPTPEFHFPAQGIPLIGALSGILIGAADKFRLFNRQLLQFFITPALSLILAFVSVVIMLFYLIITRQENLIRPHLFPISLTFMLIGFMTIFGYTFPRRWFRHWVE
jgi:hypothetical protein